MKAVPAVRAVGVPVLPVAVPGAAVSPGISNCSFVNGPAVSVVAGLVFAVFVPSVTSVAVTVRLPAVTSVTTKVCVPATSGAFAGNCAFASLDVMRTVSPTELMRFQFASTAFTVTRNAAPTAGAVGVPVLPVAVPGAAVSPGISSCSFVNAPGFAVVAGLVFAVFVPSVMFVAVTVRVPAVLRVMLSVRVPAASAMFAGNVALASLDVTPTVWVTELTRFHCASTAFTVTVNAVPAVRAVGVPVLPVAVPGAAVSPGISSCSFVNAPAVTVVAGLVFAVFVPSVTSVAVTVRLPAVTSVTVSVCVPATSAAFAGNCAFTSLDVMRTVSVTVLTTFQAVSTAFTVTENTTVETRAVGVPVLPVAVPGAAVSPAIRSCSFVNAPVVTVVSGLVFAVFVPSVTSVAVTV